MSRFEILLSCVNLDYDIIKKSNIKSDTVIINQCGKEGYNEYENEQNLIRIYNSDKVGLTKSRNFAIEQAIGDICLLCDDDEVFFDGYESKIIEAYEKIECADVIAFKTENIPEKFHGKVKKLNRLDIMKISSWQISFKRKSIIDACIRFDENMGSGTGNGAEEEFKFLSDCLKARLNIYYFPYTIADVKSSKSLWFKGYNNDFFINRGITTRYIMGFFPSILYAVYYAVFKRKQFKNDISVIKAFGLIFKGVLKNKLGRLKKKRNE